MNAAAFDGTYAGWRTKARELLAAGAKPENVLWSDAPTLFGSDDPVRTKERVAVPKDFLALAETVACHRSDRKWAQLYRVLYRLTSGEKHLLEIESDPEVRDLMIMRKEVGHDLHRMHAFVRFRQVEGSDPERFVAWHQPDHLILHQAGPWFARRFAAMHWSILTPEGSVHWNTESLQYGPGVPRSQAPTGDALEELWRAYYGSIFNPARANAQVMTTHMPKRYWPTMPETELIPDLLAEANKRQTGMIQAAPMSARPYIPVTNSLPVLREAAHSCRGCDLYAKATQPVFSEGPLDAQIVLVGEQPGDREDREGRLFIGPAGQLLDRALLQAGLDRGSLYLTEAVKHFRYEERGKRRIHKTASKAQVSACQPWIEAEINLVRPKLIVCLGKTAALSILGRDIVIGSVRGQVFPHRSAGGVLVTVHPSFVLRVPEPDRQAQEFERLVADLKLARDTAA